MKVLIVEDNPAMRHLMRNIVGEMAEVYECADGAEALPQYEAHELGGSDWVLMDVRMPQVNGIEATRQLRAVHSEARILIVTNCDDSWLRDTARRAGACGYLLKENLDQLPELLVEPNTSGLATSTR